MSSIMAGWPVHAIPERAFRRRGVNVGGKERWLSALGGSALFLYGVQKKSAAGVALAALGGALITRGATGRCQVYQALGRSGACSSPGQAEGRATLGMAPPGAIRAQRTITIGKSREELYRFLRDLENLPRFMRDIERVRSLGHTRSHWAQRGPLGSLVEWDMEIVEDVPGERILWRSAEPQCVRYAGAVYFTPAPGGRGTEVTIVIDHDPPGGALGRIAAMVQGGGPDHRLRGDLRRLRQLMETGEIPTTVGQPSGRTCK
jgi:uncharacterized membrane protein